MHPKKSGKWYEIGKTNYAYNELIETFVTNVYIHQGSDLNAWYESNGWVLNAATQNAKYEASNPSVHSRHKTKMKSRAKLNCDSDYLRASRRIYSNTVGYGEKHCPMNERTAAYIDGNCPRSSYDIYRPLTTSFPTVSEKSHKQK